MGPGTHDEHHDEPDDELTARLIADAEEQLHLSPLWGRLDAALNQERITGPVRAAHYVGERAAAIARTAAERDGATPEEVHERAIRAFWAAYYRDLADEAYARADAWRDEMQRCGDPPDPLL